MKTKEESLKRQIERTQISDRSTMLDMVDLLSRTLGEKIKI